MSDIRSFIAIELDQALLDELDAVQKKLRALDSTNDIRWVRPAGIHLTLKFLGDVPADNIAQVSKALDRGVAGMSPFLLTAERLGVFPNWRRPRVVWVGLSGALNALQSLHENVEQAMTKLGFEPEARKFNPHLTIGRVGRQAGTNDVRQLGEALREQTVHQVGHINVVKINLMRSQLNPKGAIYSELSTHRLA